MGDAIRKAPKTTLTTRGRLGLWRTASLGALIVTAAALVTTLVGAAGTEKLAYDFRAAYFPAAESLLETGSPYSPADEALGDGQEPYVYPPQLAILLVPLTALPIDVAAFLAFLGSLAALLAALAVAGVRDPRCFAAVLIWAPAFNALEMANLSAPLALGVALAWRYRDVVWQPAIALGTLVSMKLFLWPLLVWAVAMKRYRVAALATAIGLALTVGAWAVIGLDELASYPDQLARVPDQDSYSIKAVSTSLGGSPIWGDVLSVIAGGALLGGAVRSGLRGDDFRSFTFAIAAALAFVPVVWQHYLILLAVPVGIARPRFSAIWLLPIVLWICPRAANGDDLQPLIPAIVTMILLTILLARPQIPFVRRAPLERSATT